ncbi:hypothetical protein MHYP_G00016130 [Metynnis hypsauchen]
MIVRTRSLLLGLLVIFYLQSCAVGESSNAPKECCFSFYTRPIPVPLIREYEETRPDCTRDGFTRAGVIFTTKNGIRVCADPSFSYPKK